MRTAAGSYQLGGFLRVFLSIVALFLVVMFQVSFMPVLTDVFPDVLLVVVLSLVWAGKGHEALGAGFLGGAFWDFLTVHTLGVRSLLLVLIVVIASNAVRAADNLFLKFVTAFIASAVLRFYPNLVWVSSSTFMTLIDSLCFVVLSPIFGAVFSRAFRDDDLQLSFRDKLR
jgi:rod shape-determining protein MreD